MNKEFIEIIKQFKLLEKERDFIPIVNNQKACEFLNAFTKIGVEQIDDNLNFTWKDIKWNDFESVKKAWDAMWSYFDIDSKSYELALRTSRKIVKDLFESLKINRLIYPNNTISDIATKYLNLHLSQIVQQKNPKPQNSNQKKK